MVANVKSMCVHVHVHACVEKKIFSLLPDIPPAAVLVAAVAQSSGIEDAALRFRFATDSAPLRFINYD